MPIQIKTLSFKSITGNVVSEQNDRTINATLAQLQNGGARILDIKVSGDKAVVVYLITYETPSVG